MDGYRNWIIVTVEMEMREQKFPSLKLWIQQRSHSMGLEAMITIWLRQRDYKIMHTKGYLMPTYLDYMARIQPSDIVYMGWVTICGSATQHIRIRTFVAKSHLINFSTRWMFSIASFATYRVSNHATLFLLRS